MKNIFTILLLSLFSFSYAQEAQVERKEEKVKVGVNYSIDYNYRSLKNNDNSPSGNQLIQLRNSWETPMRGYTFGINNVYTLKRNLQLEFGVQYSKRGYQAEFDDLISGIEDSRKGFLYSSSGHALRSFKYIDNFYFMDVPLRVNYLIGQSRLRFFTSIGVSANILLKATETKEMRYTDNSVKRTEEKSPFDFRRYNLSPQVSCGLDWAINHKSNVRAEPIFRRNVFRISDTPTTGYLWCAGLNLSYYYSF